MSRTYAMVRGALILLACLGLAGWFLWRRLKKSPEPGHLILKWALTLGVLTAAAFTIDFKSEDSGQIIGLVQALVYGVILATLWAGSLARIFANRVGALFDGDDTPMEPQPLYSMAEARCKQGKYREAIWEIQNQLARFPEDITGQLMMAEIQAKHLADLPGAQLTIQRFCLQPGHPPEQVAAALNLLADLHLEYGRDSDAARQAFEQIMALLPDSPEAQRAAQRIARLPSARELAAERDRTPLHVPQAPPDLGLRPDVAAAAAAGASPQLLASQYLHQLETHPLDAETREKLAVLYADGCQRLDLASDQLEQLIQQPHQPAKRVVQWLNLLAELQVNHGAPPETVQQTLQRIIDLNPDSASANQARQRLALLKLEYNKTGKSQPLKLGVYDKDLGLKQRPPRFR
ncbi:MAG: outer membrane protein assembly factor BamD [Verrucomicrobia bacterium]|nr:outer membrane protein assembly factor BamD [Verrucomicrobiota bacterium]